MTSSTGAVDVAVIGGGVIGCAVAYYAAKRGMSVALVDQPKPGRATSASAGGLWPLGESLGLGCGVIFHRMRREQGLAEGFEPPELPRAFREFAFRSNAMFPGLAAELRSDAGMDVEFEKSSLLFVAYDEVDEAYAQALASRHPDVFTAGDWLSPEELAQAEPALSREVRGALRFRGDDQVNPYRLADALRAGARHLGARIVTHTEVTDVRVESDRVVAVSTREGEIPCAVVVNAAGAWAGSVGRLAGVHVPVHPVRGQVVATEALPEILHACISTSDCYLAQKAHGEVLIGSTTEDAGFDVSVTPRALHTLAAGAVRAIPALADVTVKRAWSGLRPGTPDELPILGPVDGLDGYLNACGHFRTGILNAPLTGLILAALAAGTPPPHPIDAFLLSRFASASA